MNTRPPRLLHTSVIRPKSLFQARRVISVTLALHAMANLAAGSAHAQAASQLAKFATKTQNSSQTNWLSHYLPEDQANITNGAWTVVTAQQDGYYHKPQCPRILTQPANQVLGFASAHDAEFAGYRPDNDCVYQHTNLHSSPTEPSSRAESEWSSSNHKLVRRYPRYRQELDYVAVVNRMRSQVTPVIDSYQSLQSLGGSASPHDFDHVFAANMPVLASALRQMDKARPTKRFKQAHLLIMSGLRGLISANKQFLEGRASGNNAIATEAIGKVGPAVTVLGQGGIRAGQAIKSLDAELHRLGYRR